MRIIVHFKKGNSKTLDDVKSITVGSKPTSPVYRGDEIMKRPIPSIEDVSIDYLGGRYTIAKNTFETLEIEFD